MTTVCIESVRVEHHVLSDSNQYVGVETAAPRLSWRFQGDARDWLQTSYTMQINRASGKEEHRIVSSDSVLVPWPSSPLAPGEKVTLEIQVTGNDDRIISSSSSGQSISIERTIMTGPEVWQGSVITCNTDPVAQGARLRPFKLRKRFVSPAVRDDARLIITALGLYQVSINGRLVTEDLLTPGWQSYRHRHAFQTYDVSPLLYPDAKTNVISCWIAEGWYAGELTKFYKRIWGRRAGLLAQLTVGGQTVLSTCRDWEWSYGEITEAELYHGECWDYRAAAAGDDDYCWNPVDVLEFDKSRLVPSQSPPVRKTAELAVVRIIQTPSGKHVLDFGQNLVGCVRVNQEPPANTERITLRHAEVLEGGELGMRPLRDAKCRDIIQLGPNDDDDDTKTAPPGRSSLAGWQPKFTFHGFRYVSVEGWRDPKPEDFSAIVFHSDMEKTAEFETSHALINQLHDNVTWSMRGNFISVPTDCPQRDERLGWTGDLQVFASTANFLYDTSGMLGEWLQDFASEQMTDGNGIPFVVVPETITSVGWPRLGPQAIWCDTSILTPWELYLAHGDVSFLSAQWDSMVAWLDRGVQRDPETRLWATTSLQLGDWLDPSSPSSEPWKVKTDRILVADAYLVHVTETLSRVAEALGRIEASTRYREESSSLRRRFQDRYVTETGRLVSDSQTAFALALRFDLLDERHIAGAMSRFKELIRTDVFRIGTGFAGTPVILQALADRGALDYAYRMLQEPNCPSWLYPVTMGATTVWERWNSMLPDGTINPGQMTSFNHYALGAVADFLHRDVGGISIVEPGWRTIKFAPCPGGSLTHCKISHTSPYGRIGCDWEIVASPTEEQTNGPAKLQLSVTVPPNCKGIVVLPASDGQTTADGDTVHHVGSGRHEFVSDHRSSTTWPPKGFQIPIGPVISDSPAL